MSWSSALGASMIQLSKATSSSQPAPGKNGGLVLGAQGTPQFMKRQAGANGDIKPVNCGTTLRRVHGVGKWAQRPLRTDVVRHVLRDLMCYAASITRAAACPQRHGATFRGNAPRVPQGLQVNER